MAAKRQVLFVQGGGEGTHDQWDNKLVASLQQRLGSEYDVHYPRMPNEGEPSYATWQPALVTALRRLPDGALLVGHSIGATLLLKVLTEETSVERFGAVLLIAPPFVGKGGWPADDWQFPAALGESLPSGLPLHLFHGVDDEIVPVSHVELYARAVPRARIHRLPGRDHQLKDDLNEVATVISSLVRPQKDAGRAT
jgi:predicted alpha/beta hydrolase family esterase